VFSTRVQSEVRAYPAHQERSARIPPPTSGALELAPRLERWRPLVSGQRFVWAMVPRWAGVWTRQQHFTLRLAALGAKILYVEPADSWTGALREGGVRGLLRAPQIEEVAPGITVLRPRAQPPGSMLSDLPARVGALQIASATKAILRRWGWKDGSYLTWHRIPISLFLLSHLTPSKVVYDITDDYTHFVSDARRKEVVKRREQQLLRRADLVFVTNPSLREPRLPLNPNVHVSLNGVDYELFATAADARTPEHPLLANVSRPRIGFVGFVSDWLDFELVGKMAERWPGRVVMVGPIKPSCVAATQRIPKAVWTGFIKDRNELPALLRGFDVLTIPFQVNELTDNMNPLKIWEYLATGKPIVSTALQSMQLCAGLGAVAKSSAEFLDEIDRNLRDGNSNASARMALAREHSWDNIFDEMMEKLAKLLGSREAVCKSPSLD